MAHAVAVDSGSLALQLHALLRDLDPARYRREVEALAYERLADIQRGLDELLSATWPQGHHAALQTRLGELAEILRAWAPTAVSARLDTDPRVQWMEFRLQVQPAYEALASSLRDSSVHVPSLRPTNYTRNAFHVANAVGVILLVELLLAPTNTMLPVALGGAVWAWSMELGRRRSPRINAALMTVFRRVAHPHEAHRINSATWYTTALLVLALLFPIEAGVAGLAVLGLGDPLAAAVGRRIGRVRLLNGRTLEGSIAFVLGGAAAAWLALQVWHPAEAPVQLGIVFTAAVFGAVAEVLTRRVDDNLAIPIAAAAGAHVASLLL